MNVILLMGGMCNQLFQRALGISLENYGQKISYALGAPPKPPEPVSTRPVRVRPQPDGDDPRNREYALYAFKVETPLVDLSSVRYGRYLEGPMTFQPQVFKMDKTIFHGCWQTEKYFADVKDKVRAGFQIKPEYIHDYARDLASDMEGAVSVHVRRGDYVGLEHFHGVLSVDYYVEAIKYLNAKKIFIFSDDRKWCREHLQPVIGGEVISGTTKFEDLYLMSKCRHAVIANSSFSWWGAWLAEQPGQIVVAPKTWFTEPSLNHEIVPERWIKL